MAHAKYEAGTGDAASSVLYGKNNGTLVAVQVDSNGKLVTSGGGGGQWTGTNPIYFNGNVGIGSTNPISALDVNGAVSAPSFIAGSGSATITGVGNNVGINQSTPAQALDVQGTVNATGFIAGASGITLGGVNNTSWPWTTSGSNIYNNNTGNVGIGTSAAPSAVLSISATTTTTGQIVQNVGSTPDPVGRVSGGTQYKEGQSFQVTSSGQSVVSVVISFGATTGSPTGQVTTSLQTDSSGPTGSNINGNATLTYTPTASSNNTITFPVPIPVTANTTYWIVTESVNSQSNGNFWNVNYTSSNVYSGGQAASYNGSSWTLFGSVDFNFSVNYQSTNPVVLPAFYTNGNVGIGTLIPNGILDVEGTISPVIFGGVLSGFQNVGIGTFTPGQLLDVKGTTRAIGFATNVGIGTTGTGSTSCLCKTFSGGICTVIGTCT